MTADARNLDAFLKALADPTRLRIVQLLAGCESGVNPPDKCGHGALCVNALVRKLGITQSAVSQHLRILRHAGLVRSAKRGSFVHYAIDRTVLEQRLRALGLSLKTYNTGP